MIRSRLKKKQKKFHLISTFVERVYKKSSFLFLSVTCVLKTRERAPAGKGQRQRTASLAPPPLQKSILDQSIEGARGLKIFLFSNFLKKFALPATCCASFIDEVFQNVNRKEES